MPYPNVDPMVGAACSGHPEMFSALGSDLGVEDLFDIVEVVLVDAHNRNEAERREASKSKGKR